MLFPKPNHLTTNNLTLRDIIRVFGRRVDGPRLNNQILKSNPLKDPDMDFDFKDVQIKEEITISDARKNRQVMEKETGYQYAGLFVLIAYIQTDYGRNKTIRHQIVGCTPIVIDGKKYYPAVGRIGTLMRLYLIPAGHSIVWPTTAIFLKCRKKGWKKT